MSCGVADVNVAVEEAAKFNRYQEVLKLEPTQFEDVEELKAGSFSLIYVDFDIFNLILT